MRTRSDVEPGTVVPVRAFPKGAIPDGYLPGGPYYWPEGLLIGHVVKPDFVTKYELADDLISAHGQWQGFNHYKRSAEAKSLVTASAPSYPPYQWWKGTFWWEARLEAAPIYPGGYYGFPDYPVLGIGEMYEIKQDGSLRIPPPPDLSTLLDRAIKGCMPQVKAQALSLNSLYELKDIPSLRNTAELIHSSARQLQNTVRRFAGTAKTLKALRRTASDVYLQYMFNVRQFISDVNGIYRAVRQSGAKARKLVNESEKTRVRHFCIDGTLYSGEDESEHRSLYRSALHADEFYDCSGKIGRRWNVSSSKFHVEIEYSYYYTDFQKRHAELLGTLDGLGINLNPAILWNAAKWTFIIDWVVGVSRKLDSLKLSNMEPVVFIHRALWSNEVTRNISCYLVTDSNGTVPVSSVTETSYTRQLFTPGAASLEASGLSPTEISLIGALIGSRRR